MKYFDVNLGTIPCRRDKVIVLYQENDTACRDSLILAYVGKREMEELIIDDDFGNVFIKKMWYKDYCTSELSSMQGFVKAWDKIVKGGD